MNKTKVVKLNKIVLDNSLFLRDQYDEDAIERYTEIYLSDGKLPPLTVRKSDMKLVDGFHRFKALEKADKKFATIEFLETDKPFTEAVKKNMEHGVPLNKGERNKAIVKMYHEDNLTQQTIADLFGLDRSRIAQVLALLETNNANDDQSDKRKKLNRIERDAVIQRCLSGQDTQKVIGDDYKIDRSRVAQIFKAFKENLVNRYKKGYPLSAILGVTKVGLDKKSLIDLLAEQGLNKTVLSIPRYIHGDLFDVIDKIPDGVVDAIITDPPYYIMGDQEWDQFESLEDFIDFTKRWLLKVIPKLKDTGRMFICFGQQWDFEIQQLLREIVADETLDMEFAHKIIWIHLNNMEQIGGKRNFKRVWDPVYYIRKKKAEEIYVPQGIIWQDYEMGDFDVFIHAQPQTNFEDEKEHPAQKPLAMMKRAILNLTKERDLVLDCFGGSGTTAIAAIQTGRNYVVIEKDDDYMEIIKERIKRALLN